MKNSSHISCVELKIFERRDGVGKQVDWLFKYLRDGDVYCTLNKVVVSYFM